MDWQCPDCKRLEAIKTPTLLKEDGDLYLCCSDCGALLYLSVKRSKDSIKPHPWGIPKSSKP